MAERVGFEPTVPGGYDGFQYRSVMTTSVSLRKFAKCMLPHHGGFVNIFMSILICFCDCFLF